MERPYFPMFVDLTGKNVLVAGGGRIALRRVTTLLRFGAAIRVVAPQLCGDLEGLEKEGRICVERRRYRKEMPGALTLSSLPPTAGKSTARCRRSAGRAGFRSTLRMTGTSATSISLRW